MKSSKQLSNKKAQSLQAALERFRAVAETTPDGIIETDRAGNIIYWNRGAEKIYGYREDEILGKQIELLLPERFRQASAQKRESFFETGFSSSEGKTFEATGIKKDGREFPVEISFAVWKGEDSSLFSAVVRDITNRKKAEEALRTEKNFIAAILETTAALIFVTDAQGRIMNVNAAFEKISGFSIEDLAGKYFWEHLISSDDRKKALESFKNFHKRETPLQHENYLLTKDGRQRLLAWSNTALLNEQGAIANVICTGIDITERKEMEVSLQKAHDELEKKVEERTDNLREANAALKVLLKQRDEDRQELEENLLSNVKELLMPLLKKIRTESLHSRQRLCLELVETNLNEIISPFSRKLSSKYLNLTPKEIQVANLIRDGKTTKEIAEFLKVSEPVISFHRKNIRDKLGLKNKKANLNTHLQSLS
ncbi:MAG: PAS domain S-box protein [Deltaproteobacteria bacterium]|nr:PAS domain S-box protein [Deltaproteobacteria bacterium]